jgi:transcriptional regulator with PAS, ATPase and Fis domain
VLERAVNLAEGDLLLPEHFARADEVTRQAHPAPEPMNVRRHLCDRVAHAEETSILDALHRHSGHRGKTAAELGISVTTLWRRLRRISGAPGFAMMESHP